MARRLSGVRTLAAMGLLTGTLALVWSGVRHSPSAAQGDELPEPAAVSFRQAAVATQAPAPYAELFSKLNRRSRLRFSDVSFDEIHRQLGDQLGATIELAVETPDSGWSKRKLTLETGEPVTLKRAIRYWLDCSGLSQCQITLAGDKVRIVGPEIPSSQQVLQTYDLRGVSNYSTAFRQRFLADIRRDVTPEAWGQTGGPWMTPAASVFAIDVYHTPAAQEQIQKLWRERLEVSGANMLPIGRLDSGKELSPAEIKSLAKQLRAKYPFESLAARLQYEAGRAAKSDPPLSKEAAKLLAAHDAQAARTPKEKLMFFNVRGASLEQLHSAEVEKFVARQGFGVWRMPTPAPSYLPAQEPPQLALASHEIDPPAEIHRLPLAGQSAESSSASLSTAPQAAQLAAADQQRRTPQWQLPGRSALFSFHAASEATFLAVDRFGLVKDRDHVAGFAPHAFTRLPRMEEQSSGWLEEPTEQWAVQRLELVSLLKHPAPRVYVSESLPRMDKLTQVQTRELNPFEQRGLEELYRGETLASQGTLNRIEMLGALRASKSCLECHEVRHGQLLGAFSYSLVRDPWIEPVEPLPVAPLTSR